MSEKSYPHRHASHITDNAAKNILRAALPPEWMLRDQADNDYGIDFHLEFTDEHNQVRGQFAAIQLKGTAAVNPDDPNVARTVAVNRTTLRLWKGYETPVLLVLVDVNTRKIYLKSIEHEIRKDPDRYLIGRSETISIRFTEHDFFDPKKAPAEYQMAKLLRVMDHELPSIVTIHRDFVRLFERYQRDGHMPVDGDGTFDPGEIRNHKYERRIRNVYSGMRKIASMIAIDWDIPTIDEIIDTHDWYDAGTEMYELHFTLILEHLDKIFQKVLNRTKLFVLIYQEFWKKVDPEFVAFALDDHPLFSELTWEQRLPYMRDNYY